MFEVVKKQNKCWSETRAKEWYNSQPFIIGCNYLPSTAINSTEMWARESFNPETIKKELKWAQDIGYNNIRVFIPYILYDYNQENLIDNIKTLLDIASANMIKVTPVLFDDCAFSNLEPYLGKQNEPGYLLHNSGWTPSPGSTIADDFSQYSYLEKYVKRIITEFSDDERILMWDLYNEPGNSNRGAKSLFLVEKAFEWARESSPIQPLTVGVWAFENGSSVNDTKFVDLRAMELSDVITIHHYGNANQVEKSLGYYQSLGYPVICTEWMARGQYQSLIEKVLPVFFKMNVGAFNWGFVNGKTQTHIPWNYDLSLGEPKVWFHDILHKDGTPYDKNEINQIKKISEKSRRENNE
jgi:hypothetical protein